MLNKKSYQGQNKQELEMAAYQGGHTSPGQMSSAYARANTKFPAVGQSPSAYSVAEPQRPRYSRLPDPTLGRYSVLASYILRQ